MDHVPLRVMVTYFGAGTEVLSERASLAVSMAGKHGGYAASDAAKFLAGKFAVGPFASFCFFGRHLFGHLLGHTLYPLTPYTLYPIPSRLSRAQYTSK